MTPEERDLSALAEQAARLANEISALTGKTGDQLVAVSSETARQRRFTWLLGTGLAIVVLLVAGLGVAWYGLAQNTQRIDDLTERLNTSQTTTRQAVLCPLYTLLIQSAAQPPEDTRPEALAARDAAIKVIRDGYTALECVPPLEAIGR